MRSLLAAAFALAACASTPRADDLPALAAALAGRWDNSAQYAGAPDELKRPPVADDSYDWIDLQRASFTPLPQTALEGSVVYLEWRRADGTISRQRIWRFRRDATGAPRMDFFTLAQPERFAGAPATAFTTLSAADLKGYGEACGLRVDANGPGAWDARVTPEECQIVAQSGRTMGIDARITVMPTGILYQEAGVLPDGAYAFRVPGGQPYDFRRTP